MKLSRRPQKSPLFPRLVRGQPQKEGLRVHFESSPQVQAITVSIFFLKRARRMWKVRKVNLKLVTLITLITGGLFLFVFVTYTNHVLLGGRESKAGMNPKTTPVTDKVYWAWAVKYGNRRETAERRWPRQHTVQWGHGGTRGHAPSSCVTHTTNNSHSLLQGKCMRKTLVKLKELFRVWFLNCSQI